MRTFRCQMCEAEKTRDEFLYESAHKVDFVKAACVTCLYTMQACD